MITQKDIVVKNIKVLGDREVSIINNNDGNDYTFGALTVEGGGAFKKGISIGIQDKMVGGLIIYDNENFYGFSDKFGLTLLSTHSEYTYLEIPDDIFNNDANINKLQPVSKDKNDHFQDLKETEKNKILNIDLNIKDVNNFYIKIPNTYDNSNLQLTFHINYIYDLNTIISNISLSFINESNKKTYFKILNNNCYYNEHFSETINENTIHKLHLEIVNEDYFMLNTTSYLKFHK
jgi:hypothetical protein